MAPPTALLLLVLVLAPLKSEARATHLGADSAPAAAAIDVAPVPLQGLAIESNAGVLAFGSPADAFLSRADVNTLQVETNLRVVGDAIVDGLDVAGTLRALQSSVSTLQNQITALQNANSALSAAITDAKTEASQCCTAAQVSAANLVDALNAAVDAELEKKTPVTTFQSMKDQVGHMQRNLILLQVGQEQQSRMKGSSGLNLVRGGQTSRGRPYFSPANSNYGFANCHNHADLARTVGLAELSVVLNGIEFQTRHNDYRLRQPHSTSSSYHSMENIPFPPVPESVLNAGSVEAQIAEMKVYFEAWLTSDTSLRDYRPYFRPVLTYIEGTWIKQEIDFTDPFESDRHQTLADSYEQLYDGITFILASGAKDRRENMPFMPTALRRMGGPNRDDPEWATWQYRVSAQMMPDHVDLPLNKVFRVSDSLLDTHGARRTVKDLKDNRHAHFEVNSNPDCLRVSSGNSCSWARHESRNFGYELIDHLMREIPGKDNHQGVNYDTAFGQTAYDTLNASEKLNTNFYSRTFKRGELDAAGRSTMYRGFSDGYLWAAMTQQDRVHGLDVDVCAPFAASAAVREETCDKDDKNKFIPRYVEQKWSYAVPLEVVFLTPLGMWNPHNFSDYGVPKNRGASPVFDGCVGGKCDGSLAKPLGGVDDYNFYKTPEGFFSGVVTGDPADTSSAVTYVRDQNDTVWPTRASGTWVHLPEVAGLEQYGKIRTRFPIAPIHDWGSTTFKELKSLQDIVFDDDWETVVELKSTPDGGVTLLLEPGISSHEHFVDLDKFQVQDATAGPITVSSAEAASHSHQVTLRRSLVENVWKWTADTITPNGEMHTLKDFPVGL